jgi:hypothetical protein
VIARVVVLLALALNACGARVAIGEIEADASTEPADGGTPGRFPSEPAPDGGLYEPCRGKACGDRCEPCAPDDRQCIPVVAELTLCDVAGNCNPGVPACVSDAGSD